MLRQPKGAGYRTNRDRGVAAVEMALLAPLVVLLLMGVIETSWLLMQSVDVRQGAREAGRLAAVDYGDSATIAGAGCAAMDNDDDTSFVFSGASAALGGDIEVTATKTADHLTSFLNWVFPPGMTLSNTATFALEVSPPTWNDGMVTCP